MSRDSSGNFTLPLPDVVSGDVIEASWANTTLDDVSAELTDSLSRSGKGNMSVPLKVVAGTVSAPGLSFASEANSGLYRAGAADIRLAVNSAEVFRATSAGLRLASGDLIIGTAGEGVDFSANTGTAATGAATTSELLSLYEEGTWTPNVWDFSLSSSEGQTYTRQLGWFTRVGRLVTIDARIDLSDKGTLTAGNNVLIGPLPYTSINATNYRANLVVGYGTTASFDDTTNLSGQIAANTNYIVLHRWSESSIAELTIIEIANTASIHISGSYIV